MKITLESSQRRMQQDAVLLTSFSDEKGLVGPSERGLMNPGLVKKIQKFFEQSGFQAHVKELSYYPDQHGLLLFVGCGKKKELTLEQLRRAMNEARGQLRRMNISKATIMVPNGNGDSLVLEEKVQAIAESFWLGDYEFDKYKPNKSRKKLKEVVLLVPEVTPELKQRLKNTRLVCEAVWMARDLENDHSDAVTPASFAESARGVAATTGMKIHVLDETRLKQKGFGLLSNVGRASSNPPRLVVLEYVGRPKEKDSIALVGKGITFDTGGVNLKPSGSMIEEMHMDMSGAAVVLATMKVAAELKLPINLIGVMSLAENAIGGNAYKPGCVLTAYDGTTVEVGNTDAEGRLVLGDAVAYVVDQYHPKQVIDLATLTGAVIVALGFRIAGLVSNDESLAKDLRQAGERCAERVWSLPSDEDYREDIKSEKAELKNIGDGRTSGVIAGALFIEHFAKKTPWAHLDIAGTSMIPKRLDYLPKGGTGFGIRLLIEFLSEKAKVGLKS